MKKSKLNEYKIVLGQIENNGMHLIAAQMGMNFNQVITLALNEYLRKHLKKSLFNELDNDRYVQQRIGEIINANRGIWGYDSEINDIPEDKKWLLLKDVSSDSIW